MAIGRPADPWVVPPRRGAHPGALTDPTRRNSSRSGSYGMSTSTSIGTRSGRRTPGPRSERGAAEVQPQVAASHRGARRPARHDRVQPRARRSARARVDELSRRPGRPVEPDLDHQLRQGKAPLPRVERRLLGPEPPRALPGEGAVSPPSGGGGAFLLLLVPPGVSVIA